MINRPQKITFAEMRAQGIHGLLVYCSDYHCSHWTASSNRWPDDVPSDSGVVIYFTGVLGGGARGPLQPDLDLASRLVADIRAPCASILFAPQEAK